MKISLFLIAIFLAIPTYAACSIETGAACTVSQYKEIDSPKGPLRRDINEFPNSPKQNSNQLPNNMQKNNTIRDFGNKSDNYSYNADCQFGICKNSSGAPQLFKNRQ